MATKQSVREGYRASRRGYRGSVEAHGTRRYKLGKATARGVSHAPEIAASGAGAVGSTAASTTVGSTSAQGVIVTSALVVFGLGFLNSYIVPRKTPRIRLFIGVALLYIGLSVIAQFNAKLARAFAILVMVTAILAEGGGVMNWLLGRGSHDSLNVFNGGTGTPNLPQFTSRGIATAIPPANVPLAVQGSKQRQLEQMYFAKQRQLGA